MVSDLGDYILRFRGSDNSTFELIKTIEEPGTPIVTGKQIGRAHV